MSEHILFKIKLIDGKIIYKYFKRVNTLFFSKYEYIYEYIYIFFVVDHRRFWKTAVASHAASAATVVPPMLVYNYEAEEEENI